ncbi:hypothetical protein ACLB2K_077040 [Fragaria x ananassa]
MAEGLRHQNKQPVISDGRPHIESDDLLIDILSRLPVKTLVRFRCVCKSWRVLISDSHLVTTHLRRSNRRRLLFSLAPYQSIDIRALNDVVCHHLISKHFRPVVLPVYIGALKIVGSCNGLVCLLGNSELIVVWNPSTRHARLLTVPNEFRFGSIRFYGFGYDSTIDDYKVVVGHTSMKSGTRATAVVIVQLKTESWRTIDCVDYVHLLGQGCLVNGALHWVEMAWKEVLMIQPVLHARIMSFDLAEETFREFIPLSYLSRDERLISARVGIAEDSLFVYLFTDSGIKMWVMKEYRVNGPWTKETQIPTKAPHLPQKFCYCNPICILENGEVLINSGDLMLYNPNGGGNRNVLGTPADLAHEPVMYVESLVSPFKEDN